MDLRAELLPPSVSGQRLDELCREIERIAALVLAGAETAEDEITAFNERTGHDYAALDFAECLDAYRSPGRDQYQAMVAPTLGPFEPART